MLYSWPRIILFGILLYALQFLLLQNIDIGLYLSFQIYFYPIIIMPLKPRVGVLLVAFGMGLLADFFFRTLGVHAAACTLLAYARMHLLGYFIRSDDPEPPHAASARLSSYFSLMGLLLFLFHYWQLVLYQFTLLSVVTSVAPALVRAGISLALILVLEILFYPPGSSQQST